MQKKACILDMKDYHSAGLPVRRACLNNASEVKMKAEKTKETEFQADEVIGRIRAKMAWVSEKTRNTHPITPAQTVN